jgi:hypothetical protein
MLSSEHGGLRRVTITVGHDSVSSSGLALSQRRVPFTPLPTYEDDIAQLLL